MSIRERRSGVWQIRAYAGINEAGRTKCVYKTFHGSKSEARKEELKLKATAGAMPRGAAAQSLTLSEYFERWMNLYIEPSAAPKTISSYRMLYNGAIKPRLGQMRLTAINTDVCQLALNEALKTYAHSTVKTAKAILSACLNRARIAGYIASNPVADVRLPRHQQDHVRALTAAELNAFVEAALSDGCMYGPLVATAALTGMRRGELMQLKWGNVDFAVGRIRVREGGSRPGTTKSATGRRDVAMPAMLRSLLLDLYEADVRRRTQISDWNPSRLVFTNREGNAVNPVTHMSGTVRRLLRKVGVDLPNFRLHDLRHSHGSLLVNAGAPVTDVAARLGQVVQTTVRTYLHPNGEGDKGLTDILDSIARQQMH